MFKIENSILVVIDVQGKLASLMIEKGELYNNIINLVKSARILKIPIIFTEQVPEKIGKTIDHISHYFDEDEPISKTSFSCYLNDTFKARLEALKRKDIIVCGIETHVCVYQTAFDLLNAKYNVAVVEDAVSSRSIFNKKSAINRMKSIGAGLTNTEMIICELLRSSEHKHFKKVLSLIR